MTKQVKLRTSLVKPLIRSWMSQGCEHFEPHSFVLPMFISNRDCGTPEPIESMPGVFRHSIDSAVKLIGELIELNLRSILLFPVMSRKGFEYADDRDQNPVLRLLPLLKDRYPDLYLIVDVCLCGFTDDGHCYVSDTDGNKDPLATLTKLSQVSVSYACAGCDMVAPSDMNDGRVAAIRKALNEKGHINVSIMSYSAKFASNFYGPFRDAADSAPKHGDRASYQLPTGSTGLALRAIERDIEEGADIVMVKPGLPYLDILAEARSRFPDIPRAVYHVSGEYSMLMSSAEKGYLSLLPTLWEIMTCFKRAGASIIITYYTPILLKEITTLKNV